jgi:hypothetical protein
MTRRGKPRTDMPWVEEIDETDEEFISFIKSYATQSRPNVLYLLEKYLQHYRNLHYFHKAVLRIEKFLNNRHLVFYCFSM